MTRSENEVDQIVFRWDSENLTGSTGFGPVAWSGPRDEAENLFRTSGPLLRASGEETRPALIRLQRRAEVMLIRRLPLLDADGGTSVLCHALVGSPELLEPATCLGLHAWTWEGADVDAARVRGRLPVVPEEVLVPATGRGQGELDRTLAYATEELTGAVAELLRHPDERFTVLDAPGDTACPVLWGLHSMFGTLTDRRWTFATHDTVELPALRYVFVGRWSGAASRNTDRRRVDPRERSGDRAEEVAARLVRHHLRGIAEGEGGEYAVGSALHAASAARSGPLLETATRALDTLDGRAGAVAPPEPPVRKPVARRWGWTSGGRPAGEQPGSAAEESRGTTRPGPAERPDLWFRADSPPSRDRADGPPQDRSDAPSRDRADGPPQDRSDALSRNRTDPLPKDRSDPAPGEPWSSGGGAAPGRADPLRPEERAQEPSYTPDLPPRPPGPADRPVSVPVPRATPTGEPSARTSEARSDGPAPVQSPPRPEPVPPQAPPHPGPDPYPRPVLPLVAPEWTGPVAGGVRAWPRARGRERDAETGLVHKLPMVRTVDEARELVERGGSRELLDALRRPQAYVVLTLLLRETARRLPSWDHPLRRELCEVALGQDFWAVAPPGGEADPSDPSEEQRAANAAELHRWAVRPLLGGGDAPVGTVAALLSRLRTSPAPSARETFWLIVDGERPGLPEAVWATLLREAYGVPRATARPGGPGPRPSGDPDDPGSGYTRRFLRRAGMVIGGLVVAILLVAVREWFV
ncbi:hypothetical protein [Streptomyces sp. CB02261]|uniref:hypothetical protein n=1 Tax=Streptomyces sp. CB02261 TaxID=1703940 RepID=UPI00093D7444|nr:hypothetical protein [Streptomyces sp. CB02261]OKJ60583.1 hypothetical protein AMK29_25510 [Streptomyces sp. CB02261]